jgi:hypothetical protein
MTAQGRDPRVVDVLVLAFNRPDPLRRVLESLRGIPGVRLHVEIDGPRPGAAQDEVRIAQVMQQVNAAGEYLDIVHLSQKTENLGCGPAVASAVLDFFRRVPEGIVLEDDCVPTPEFFDFARWGLETFRNDARVGLVCGTSFARSARSSDDLSPGLSRYPAIWGWASWANRLRGFSERRPMGTGALRSSLIWRELGLLEKREWRNSFIGITRGGWANNWDVQFVHTMWTHGYLSLIPPFPLVENVGFGEDGTHTSGARPQWLRTPPSLGTRKAFVEGLSFYDCDAIQRSHQDDAWISKTIHSPSIVTRIGRRIAHFRGS